MPAERVGLLVAISVLKLSSLITAPRRYGAEQVTKSPPGYVIVSDTDTFVVQGLDSRDVLSLDFRGCF
jgi:hypothetical protein